MNEQAAQWLRGSRWEMEGCSVEPEGLEEREELLSVLVCMDVVVCEANEGRG